MKDQSKIGMKKNILVILLAFTTLFFFAYAFIKADEATKAAIEVSRLQNQVNLLEAQAKELKQQALNAAAEARMVQAEAERALQECQSK